MLGSAQPGPWLYSGQVRSTDDPRVVATRTAKAKFLDVLKADIPYKLEPVISSWTHESYGLKIGINVDSANKRVAAALLGDIAVIKEVARRTEDDLRNFFQCSVFVYINVNLMNQESGEKKQSLTTLLM